jgi:hypothetical protein
MIHHLMIENNETITINNFEYDMPIPATPRKFLLVSDLHGG